MNLLQLKQAAAKLETNHSILIYGPPKGGKTWLAATAALIPEVKRIFFFSLENGHETILNMDLPDWALEKIIIFKIQDTRENPLGIETILKSLTQRGSVKICDLHGRVDCAECMKAKEGFTPFALSECTHFDLVIIDTGSQLGDSALAAACLGKPGMYKPTFDEYGMVNKWLGDACSVIQQCVSTNFVVLTHEIALEDDEGKDRIFPLMGSKQFSMKCAKFFGTVVYVHKKLGKHVAGSGSTYRPDLLTGSRLNVKLENSKDPSMRDILIAGGVLARMAPSSPTSDPTSIGASNETVVPQQNQPTKHLSIAERMKLSKASS